ncbi:iron-containing alcohol dehydrogenase [Oceanispirochaeta sp.]|jgi:alcohol dehydrogenase class IV|uniref:iron-containing alcohol dehydrogenase n=1 Tax=Oceanispirochaeta sp. TaxID=2035350 RepID=UPI0026243D54|nr:iron-containing alcohol dehydrogenase [Oceanispirochaeta sp.]MDA3957154.1 iron-containing alcohol dehydrogenase [Oceanispirochaeta sp.]
MAEIFLKVPSRILQGVNETNRLGIEISKLGKRVLLISETILKEPTRKLQKLLESHGIGTIVYDEEPLKGTSFTIESCQNLARGSHVESILGFGGGRTLSIARAVASSVPEVLHPDILMERGSGGGISLPCVELISDFWSPLLLQPRFSMTDSRTGVSRIIEYHPNSLCLQVCDPVQSLALPERYRTPLFFELLLNTLVCAVIPSRSFLSEVHSLSAFRRIWHRRKSLIGFWDLNCATDLMEAGFLTAMAHQETGSFWTGILIESVSGHFRVSRPITAMILMPYIMDYICGIATSEIQHFLGQLTDLEDVPPTPEALRESLRELIGWYSMPSQLRNTGILQDSLALAAETAGQMLTLTGRGGITVDQMFSILKSSW